MADEEETIEVTWNGPYGWPEFEVNSHLPAIPKVPGVYLQTFEYQSGYLIYAAGITRRAIPIRFKEHTRKYMNGEYNVLDISAVQQGVRKEIWHGWDYARRHREEFEEQRSIILDAVQKQLAGFRIFVTDIEEPRVLERIEASVMNNLYKQQSPVCDIPDRGMRLAPRLPSEKSIVVKNNCNVLLHGLPVFLEI